MFVITSSEFIVIPTRLGVSYKTGTVVGFNPNTGSVLVFANRFVDIHNFEHHEFPTVRDESLKHYPDGFQWPSKSDFQHLGIPFHPPLIRVGLYIEKVLNRARLTSLQPQWPCYLVSRTSVRVSSNEHNYVLCRIVYFVENNFRIFARLGTYTCDMNNGLLLPVYYITGNNCNN